MAQSTSLFIGNWPDNFLFAKVMFAPCPALSVRANGLFLCAARGDNTEPGSVRSIEARGIAEAQEVLFLKSNRMLLFQ